MNTPTVPLFVQDNASMHCYDDTVFVDLEHDTIFVSDSDEDEEDEPQQTQYDNEEEESKECHDSDDDDEKTKLVQKLKQQLITLRRANKRTIHRLTKEITTLKRGLSEHNNTDMDMQTQMKENENENTQIINQIETILQMKHTKSNTNRLNHDRRDGLQSRLHLIKDECDKLIHENNQFQTKCNQMEKQLTQIENSKVKLLTNMTTEMDRMRTEIRNQHL